MKKVYFLLIVGLLLLKTSFAGTYVVQVSNFQFSPATINAMVGDTIKWTYVDGFHTTTSTDVPAGAATWDAPMQHATDSFTYVLSVIGTYTYDCTIHPFMIGTLNVSAALPVVLTNFKTSASKTGTALLSWSTAGEVNTSGFDIMRSTDGSRFEKIGSVPATGNVSVAAHYTYTDNTMPLTYRFIYYSLRISDKDGSKTNSDIERFTNGKVSQKLIVSLSPNPVARPGHLLLQFNSEKENTMHAQLFDAAGKLVKAADMSAVPGLNNGHFHIGDVAPGKYTMVFTMDAQKESYSILVQ